MRKTLLLFAYLFTALSVVFSVLPLDTLAFVMILPALLLIVFTYLKSAPEQRKWPKRLFIVAYLCMLGVLGKTYLIDDEVATDQVFEQQKIEAKQEAKQELEELENDLE